MYCLIDARDQKSSVSLFSFCIQHRSFRFQLYRLFTLKIPKVVLQKSFEMFWQSLQVTFEIFCSNFAQVGTSVFLDQTSQINGHFGYIWTELIEQKDHL